MKKIGLILKREYLVRVKKKSFILMTLIGPLLFILFYAGIIYFTFQGMKQDEETIVFLDDRSGLFENQLQNQEHLTIINQTDPNKKETLILTIPDTFKLFQPSIVQIETSETISVKTKKKIENLVEKHAKKLRREKLGLNQNSIDSLNQSIAFNVQKINNAGEKESYSSEFNSVIGILLSTLIYLFIFLYGMMVMRSVIEEKSNRIVELIVSSVKPFELMMGKILGVALVGLTQIGIWIGMTAGLTAILNLFLLKNLNLKGLSSHELQDYENLASSSGETLSNLNPEMLNIISSLASIDFGQILVVFILCFIGGYLLYSAIFAAIGAAVDSESDAQQFTLPVTLPLVFSMVISYSMMATSPNGKLAQWLSFIPFSSPITLIARLPYQPPTWQIVLSIFILYLSFILVVWLAARIYKIGILSYGKKVKYKQLLRWLIKGE